MTSSAPPPDARALLDSGALPGRRPILPAAEAARLPDEALLDLVQRETFRFFWEGAHPTSGLARDRITVGEEPEGDLVGIGGSGFGIMAVLVAVERGWVSRQAALDRIGRMLDLLFKARCYHGVFPHFLDGRTGATIPFGRKDDGGDLVETSYLLQGLLCARQYFAAALPQEERLRALVDALWREAEWTWYTQGRKALTWHWSPNNGFALDHDIRGWNECLVTYVLAAASPTHAIDPEAYHNGFATSREFLNGRRHFDVDLPLGPHLGGPLFFAHYSFCGLDPHGLADRYADYWQQNTAHTRINHAHCLANPHGHKGYGPQAWGLTASDDPDGYAAHAPDADNGTISPTAALSSFPYAPREAMAALRGFLTRQGDRIWTGYGFVDAFNESRGWTADTVLAIDQGPIVVMIENHRTGLLWRLFMGVPDVQTGLQRLGFSSQPVVA